MKPRSVDEVIRGLIILLAFAVALYRAWISMAAVLILLLWFFQGDLRDRLQGVLRHRLSIAILVFIALNLLSLLWSTDPVEGIEYWKKYLYLLLVPAVASTARASTVRRAAVAFFAGTCLAAAAMPVVILADIHIGRTHPGNPALTMSHLDFSMVLAAAAAMAIVRLADLGSDDRRHRLAWIVLIAWLIAGLVINIGRSGQFALVATLIVLLPLQLSHRRWWVRVLAVIGVVVGFAAVFLAVPKFQSRIVESVTEIHAAVVDQEISGNQGKRVAGALVGLEIARQHPVLGTGIGGNMPEFRRLLVEEYPEFEEAIGWFPHLHNQYIQVVSELGLVGLVSLLAIFAALFGGRYRSRQARSAAAALGCIYLFGFFGDPYLHKQIPLVLFALAAGLISTDDEAFTGRDPTGEE